VHFLTPEFTARVHGPSTRPVNSGSGNRPLPIVRLQQRKHCRFYNNKVQLAKPGSPAKWSVNRPDVCVCVCVCAQGAGHHACVELETVFCFLVRAGQD